MVTLEKKGRAKTMEFDCKKQCEKKVKQLIQEQKDKCYKESNEYDEDENESKAEDESKAEEEPLKKKRRICDSTNDDGDKKDEENADCEEITSILNKYGKIHLENGHKFFELKIQGKHCIEMEGETKK